MDNKAAVKYFRNIAKIANQMADHITLNPDKIDDIQLASMMGELHSDQQSVEQWLFKILTTRESDNAKNLRSQRNHR
jgi:hypothetical protein